MGGRAPLDPSLHPKTASFISLSELKKEERLIIHLYFLIVHISYLASIVVLLSVWLLNVFHNLEKPVFNYGSNLSSFLLEAISVESLSNEVNWGLTDPSEE